MQKQNGKKPVNNTGKSKKGDEPANPTTGEGLSPQENKRLARLENDISRANLGYIDKGSALWEINTSRLYRQNFKSFGDYCHERWEMEKATAHRLIDAATVASVLKDAGLEAPGNEAQARNLTRFLNDFDKLAGVWQAVLDRGERITAKLVEEIAEEMYPTELGEEEPHPGEAEPNGSDNNGGENPPQSPPSANSGNEYGFVISAKASPEAIVALGRRLHLSPHINEEKGIGDVKGETGVDSFGLFSDLAAWIVDNKPLNFSLELKEREPVPGPGNTSENLPLTLEQEEPPPAPTQGNE
jgi:hypothetical protein